MQAGRFSSKHQRSKQIRVYYKSRFSELTTRADEIHPKR